MAKTQSSRSGTAHIYASLPSGKVLIPRGRPEDASASVLVCDGPDAYGGCPGAERLCFGATWIYSSSDPARRWRIPFSTGSSVCPVAVLDPLGALPSPGD